MNKKTYIKAVIAVFGLLILSRIPQFIQSGLSPVILVSSVVELLFIIWGVLVLRKDS